MKKRMVYFVIIFLSALIVTACSSLHRVAFKSKKEPDITASIDIPTHGDIWYLKEGLPIEMISEAGNIEKSVGQGFKRALLFSSQDKFAIVVNNTHATQRFDKGVSTFYTRRKPTEMGIVRFTVDPEKKRRYIWVVAQVGSDRGFFYPESDDIPFTYAKMSNGIYRITITKSLIPGEYGIVVERGDTGFLTYDFGISDSR
ncbi:MAG: hypothetical protein ACU837_08535 [Gammaproteobacteria bacterium]